MLRAGLAFVLVVVGMFVSVFLYGVANVTTSSPDLRMYSILSLIFGTTSLLLIPRKELSSAICSQGGFNLRRFGIGFLVLFLPLTFVQLWPICDKLFVLDVTITRMVLNFPLLFLVIGAGTLAEELLFRGGFRRWGPKSLVLQWLFCTVPWLVLHYQTPQAIHWMYWVNLAVMGSMFWWSTQLTGGLETAWGLHLGNNLAIFLVFCDALPEVRHAVTTHSINYACLATYVVGWILVGISHKGDVSEKEIISNHSCGQCVGSSNV